jgi:hypothetical protein
LMRCLKSGPNPNHSFSGWFSSQLTSIQEQEVSRLPHRRRPVVRLLRRPRMWLVAGRRCHRRRPHRHPRLTARCHLASSAVLRVFSEAKTRSSPGRPTVSPTSPSPSPLGSHSKCWSTRMPLTTAVPGAEQRVMSPNSAWLAAVPPTPPSGASSAHRRTFSPPPRLPWTPFPPGCPSRPSPASGC